MKKFLNLLLITVFCLQISSCAQYTSVDEARLKAKAEYPIKEDGWRAKMEREYDPLDRGLRLSRDDYKNLKHSSEPRTPKRNRDNLPKISSLLAPVEEPEISNDKIVSLSVSEDVPLKDVIVELARRAEVDVEIDPSISGGVLFIAKDKPFSEVMKRLCDLANLRYTFKEGVLRVENDTPYLVNYKFNIIDQVRKSSGGVNTSFSMGGGGGGGSGGGSSGGSSGGSTGGSNAELSIKSGDGDVWKSVEDGVTAILKNSVANLSSKSDAASEDGKSTAPVIAAVAAKPEININKMAGLISINATGKQHKKVKEYLDVLHMSLTSQVLIETKVIEVALRDEYKSGINWSTVGSDLSATGSFIPGTASAISSGVNSFGIGVIANDIIGDFGLTGSISLLEKFGVTRSLSNPRISTLNNQYATLSFAENKVYFTVEIEEEDATTGDIAQPAKTTISSELNTVPLGLVLGLQPSIDLDRNEILMSVRPSLTRQKSSASNIGLQLAGKSAGLTQAEIAAFNSDIPVVEMREMDTVLRIKSGEVMVIGGLLEDRSDNVDVGVPYAARIPVFGNAFKSVDKQSQTIETVIFIKATIIPGQGVGVEDKNLYNKFNQDRRSFNF
jgi:MSHA type pilus biogenesis protein MshL